MLRIRPMTADDLPLGMRLKSQAGWNQSPADWQRFLAMQSEGCLVAELDGVAVGTTVVTAFESVAWISMVLVEQSVRGRGIGKALMNQALELAAELGCTSIRLDATPLGQPLYESLGFVPQYELTRYAGIARSTSAVSISPTIRIPEPEEIAIILAIDHSVTGTRRDKFLLRLFVEQPDAIRVAEFDGEIAGYLTVRFGSDAIQLGPCIAESPVTGHSLLTDALSRYSGSGVYWDLPTSHSAAVALAQSAGLTPQRQLTRMCRGDKVNDDVPKLWASSGPELG
ncbi:MAG: GNAT family N-acetyltransferase [Pirellulaceae bacterium]